MKKSSRLVIGSLITAASSAAVSAFAGYMLFNEVMNRNAKIYPAIANKMTEKMIVNKEDLGENDPRIQWFEKQTPIEYEMINDKNYRLKARMIPAEKESKVYVFCSHGYRSSGNGEYNRMTKFYHDLGANVFIVDHAAHGESDGKYIGFGYYEYRDCIAWLKWMIEKFGEDIQIVLEGISMGSATVMMMTGADDLPSQVKFTVADCGYTSAKAEFEFCMKEYVHLPEFPIMTTANAFNKVINGYDFGDASPIDAVAKAKIPMLFIHGDADNFVPTHMVHQLYAACASEDKDLLLVKGAGHAESYRTDSEAYEAKVKSFFDKYIEK